MSEINIAALNALRDMVARGEASSDAFEEAGFNGDAEAAYLGDLDAFVMVMLGHMPNRRWSITINPATNFVYVEIDDRVYRDNQHVKGPAYARIGRVAMLAVLDAMIAERELPAP